MRICDAIEKSILGSRRGGCYFPIKNLPKRAKNPNLDRQKMANWLMKMASNKKMQENKSTSKFNFTIENW